MHKRMHLRAVRKIELQAERRDTAAVSRFAIQGRHTTGGRAADNRSRRNRQRYGIQRVLKRETVIRGKRTAITKRCDHKLAIFGFVVTQTAKDRRRLRRKTTPEAKLVVTSLQKKRIIVCL